MPVQREPSPVKRILERRERRSAAAPGAFVVTRQRELTAMSWGELLAQARRFGAGLVALGLERGDVIGILAPDGPEAVVAALGALLIGACLADLGDGRDLERSLECLRRADCRMAICGGRDQAEMLVHSARQLCGERSLIGWGAASSVNGIYPFGQVCLKGTELADREPVHISDVLAAVQLEDSALLVPDSHNDASFVAVRLSHDNCLVAAESLRKSIGVVESDRIVNLGTNRGLVETVVLALLSAHTGSSLVHDWGDISRLALCQVSKATIVIADGESLAALQREIDRELLVGAAWRRTLGSWAMRVGNEAARRRISGSEMGPFLAISHRLADSLVLSVPRQLLGGQVRRCLVRAEGMRRNTRWFFEAVGISPLGFYGVPASGGIGLLELPEDPRPGSYGRGMPGVDVWVDAQGRVRVRGGNVSRTAPGVDERGWLDLEINGEIDEDGTIWPERSLGALDAPSLAVLPIAEPIEP
jgi:long-subunit acyl-CoA synthetase (AMP-forming)